MRDTDSGRPLAKVLEFRARRRHEAEPAEERPADPLLGTTATAVLDDADDPFATAALWRRALHGTEAAPGPERQDATEPGAVLSKDDLRAIRKEVRAAHRSRRARDAGAPEGEARATADPPQADSTARAEARRRHPTARGSAEVIDPVIRTATLAAREAPAATGPAATDRAGGPTAALRRTLWPLTLAVVVVGALFTFVFPTRTWVDQRRSISATERELAEVRATNDALQQRFEALNTDAEIERLARERYNLVRPGEVPYAILPAPAATTLGDGFPFDLVRDILTLPPAVGGPRQ